MDGGALPPGDGIVLDARPAHAGPSAAHLRARGTLTDVDHGSFSRFSMPGSPLRFEAATRRSGELGWDNEAVHGDVVRSGRAAAAALRGAGAI